MFRTGCWAVDVVMLKMIEQTSEISMRLIVLSSLIFAKLKKNANFAK